MYIYIYIYLSLSIYIYIMFNGLIRACEDSKSESDWKMPKGANGGKWKSEVKWSVSRHTVVKTVIMSL